ncbi:ABC transporter ATP-binding protein [Pisciglobus halotolerans]|uniref:ATP-binding cassette, subfamily B n=1 Tax=Pisciglobus halotolerans TaxID=745365 RepID=A0A1I3ATR3_9LACT|nr:ABC transporter ATP-binding protein [Pisciglobus halotolerans]SFH52741.1 ATP-binding cassette, subfamily B [Pisciglobus halotolerans]
MSKHAGKMSGTKPRNFKQTYKNLLAYIRVYLPAVIFALVLAMGAAIISLVGPRKLSEITDLITAGLKGEMDIAAIEKIAFLLVILYVISFVANYVQGFIMATITQRVAKKLRRDISEKINRLPLRYFDSNSTGDVLSRVTNDVDMISQTMNQSISSLVTAATMFIGSLFMMAITNIPMTLAAIASTLVGFGLMTLIVKNSQQYFSAQQRALGAVNGHVEEIYSGHNVVKAYNAEREAKETFDTINDELYQSAWKSQFFSGIMMPLMNFIGNFGYVLVSILGASLALNGKITFGVIVAFMMYIRLFTQPLSQFAQAATSLQSTAAASERVFDFLDEDELGNETDKTAQLENVRGEVEFDHVHFGYTPDRTIINDFSVYIKPGQKVAIVGPTGAGKTTIVNLLMRFYEVNSGSIKIDGIPTTDLTRENVHDQFCMVLQDTWIFGGTVRDNVVYNVKGVTDAQVEEACKAVGLDHFVHTLPQGYDTVLDDQTSLSAGQKQLITIARAMIKDAPLLILDEATSSVDTRTEALIQEAMDKLMVGRTSFVIAHRLSTIRNSDLILVMDNGDIIEKGNHEELLAKGGFYANLYNSQFEEA